MIDRVWTEIKAMDTPGFFITAECEQVGSDMPRHLHAFITTKLARIQAGVRSRKFTFTEANWRIILTFFPTNEVVDERYALKNKYMKFRV